MADEPAQIAAVLLAGGQATRLGGADKPGLLIGGRSLLATVASAAAGAGASRIVIVGPVRPGLASSGLTVEFTTEQPPGSGPVPALRAGLGLVAEPRLLLLAADLPFLRGGHLRDLLAASEQRAGAMYVDDHGRPQWLISCWRSAAVRSALNSYDGASLGGVLGPLRPAELAVSSEPDRPPPWMDCDTSEDVAAAVSFTRRHARAREGRGTR